MDAPAPPPLAPGAWAVLGQSMPKPSNDYYETDSQVVWRSNEDRFRFSDNDDVILAAVSDGAGSSGMFCGPWAEELVKRLPEKPIAELDGLNQWMEGFWEDFSNEFKRCASADATKLSKFVREGSCATLVACWITKKDDGVSLHWAGYGDSPFYIFQRRGGEMMLATCFPESLGTMERDPHLLNWKDLAKEAHFRAGTMDVRGPATVVLASDGIGQYILLRYLADLHARYDGAAPEQSRDLLGEFRHMTRNGSGMISGAARIHLENPGPGFIRELTALRDGLVSKEAFVEMVNGHHKEGLMPNDDATLVMIDIGGVEEEDGEDNGGDGDDEKSPPYDASEEP